MNLSKKKKEVIRCFFPRNNVQYIAKRIIDNADIWRGLSFESLLPTESIEKFEDSE